MENRGRLSFWRRWPLVRKCQLVAVITGVLITVPFTSYFATMQNLWSGDGSLFNLDPHGQVVYYLFSVGMLIEYPSTLLIKSGSHFGVLAGTVFEIVVNMALSFVIGTLVGWTINRYLNRKRRPTS